MLHAITRNGKIAIAEYNIYYEVYGSGDDVILLLPGALGTIETDLKQLIDELKQENGLTIVAVDPPGYGQSAPPFKDFVDHYRRDAQIFNQLMKQLGFKSYSTAGFSDGGRVALIMAANYRENVEKVIAWSTSSYFTDKEREYITQKLMYVSNWHRNRASILTDVYGDYLQDYWRQFIEAALEYDDIFTNDLKSIECPVFMLHGDKDPIIDNKHADFIANSVRKAKVHHFTNGGHMIHERYAQLFREKIVDFIRDKID